MDQGPGTSKGGSESLAREPKDIYQMATRLCLTSLFVSRPLQRCWGKQQRSKDTGRGVHLCGTLHTHLGIRYLHVEKKADHREEWKGL